MTENTVKDVVVDEFSGEIITPKHAILIDKGDFTHTDCLLAVGACVGPSAIRSIGTYNKRVRIYFHRADDAKKLVEQRLQIGDVQLNVDFYVPDGIKIELHDVPDEVSNTVLKEYMDQFGEVIREITVKKFNPPNVEYSGILENTRQVYIKCNSDASIPKTIDISYEGVNHTIVLEGTFMTTKQGVSRSVQASDGTVSSDASESLEKVAKKLLKKCQRKKKKSLVRQNPYFTSKSIAKGQHQRKPRSWCSPNFPLNQQSKSDLMFANPETPPIRKSTHKNPTVLEEDPPQLTEEAAVEVQSNPSTYSTISGSNDQQDIDEREAINTVEDTMDAEEAYVDPINQRFDLVTMDAEEAYVGPINQHFDLVTMDAEEAYVGPVNQHFDLIANFIQEAKSKRNPVELAQKTVKQYKGSVDASFSYEMFIDQLEKYHTYTDDRSLRSRIRRLIDILSDSTKCIS